MAFDFELRFGGLIVFAFPEKTLDRGHALLVDSKMHRPSLAYHIDHLDPDANPTGDHLIAGVGGAPFLSRELKQEILTLQVEWAGEETPLDVLRTPDLEGFIEQGEGERGLDFLANLSKLEEERIVTPSADDFIDGIRENCLAESITESPITARFDFQNGSMSAGEITQVEWRQFQQNGLGSSAGSQELADKVSLHLRGVRSVTIASDRRPNIVFKNDSKVVASITNEPRHIHSNPAHANRLDHFLEHYRVVKWKNGSSPTDLRIPYLPEHTIGPRICPASVYALPETGDGQ